MISDSELQEMQALAEAAPEDIYGAPDEDCDGNRYPCLNIGVEDFYEKARTMVPRLLEELRSQKDKYWELKKKNNGKHQTLSMWGKRICELENQLAEAKTLARQHQEQSETNLRLWEEARDEIARLRSETVGSSGSIGSPRN